MVALIGANGAGKTSTLKALSRLLDTAGGSVRYGGQEISRLPPHQLIAQGIAELDGGVDHDREAEARRQREPRPLQHEGAPAAGQQAAPGRRRRA